MSPIGDKLTTETPARELARVPRELRADVLRPLLRRPREFWCLRASDSPLRHALSLTECYPLGGRTAPS